MSRHPDVLRVVFLNGPPGCGKDTIADMLYSSMNARPMKFKAKLDELICCIHDISPQSLRDFSTREEKDEPQLALGGMSYRQLAIETSENFIKPTYGADYFGKRLWHKIQSVPTYERIIVVSDCGFYAEVEYILSNIKHSNALMLRIQRDGCNYSNDSRGYVDIPYIKCRDVQNNDTKAILRLRSRMYVQEHFGIDEDE